MRKYNRLARDCIFKSHNPPDRPLNFIDLHGLWVEDAKKLLLKRMARAKAEGEERMVVIVGQGNHSANGPRIKPAIQTLCDERSLVRASNDGNEGKIVILLEDYEPENTDTLNTSESEVEVELDPMEDSEDEEVTSSTPLVHHIRPERTTHAHTAAAQSARVAPYPDRRPIAPPPPRNAQSYPSLPVLPRVTPTDRPRPQAQVSPPTWVAPARPPSRVTPIRPQPPPPPPPPRYYGAHWDEEAAIGIPRSSPPSRPSSRPYPQPPRPANWDEEAGAEREETGGFWRGVMKAAVVAVGFVIFVGVTGISALFS